MIEISEYRDFRDFDAYGGDWDRLAEKEEIMIWSFAELKEVMTAEDTKFRILVARDGTEVVAIACFWYARSRKRYAIAERKLFDLPVRQVTLIGSRVLGNPDKDLVRRLFAIIAKEGDFDLMNVGELIVGSPLYEAIINLRGGWIASRAIRKNTTRWMINLPETFEEYLKSLGTSTRKTDTKKARKIEREHSLDYRLIDSAEQVAKFLEDGEKVSRLTYQWNIGHRLINDEGTRQHALRLARKGHLRCYMAYVDGVPGAYVWGELRRGTFLYHATGYDPRFRTESLGTIFMLWVIRDLIENTNCRIFDFGFGMGRDDDSYKSRYGNKSITCCWIQLGRIYNPYSLFIVLLQEALSLMKNAADFVIGGSGWLQRIRKATRRYGSDD